MSRQGDVTGIPFEFDATNVTYRFNEGVPVLPQAVALKSSLDEDVKNAIFTVVAILWFNGKANADQIALMRARYQRISQNIDVAL